LLLLLLLLCITHAHNSRNNTVYEFIILIMDQSLESQVQSFAGARRALFFKFLPVLDCIARRAVAELL